MDILNNLESQIKINTAGWSALHLGHLFIVNYVGDGPQMLNMLEMQKGREMENAVNTALVRFCFQNF